MEAYVSYLVAKKKGNGQEQWLATPACEGICVGISGKLQELTYAQAPPRKIRTKGDGGTAFENHWLRGSQETRRIASE